LVAGWNQFQKRIEFAEDGLFGQATRNGVPFGRARSCRDGGEGRRRSGTAVQHDDQRHGLAGVAGGQ
jgi:hypothetical protein